MPASLLLIVLLVFVGYQTQANRPVAPAVATAVATVNIEAVFQGLDERGAADADLNKLADELEAQGKEKKVEIDRLIEDQELFKPGTANYIKNEEEVLRKSHQLRAFLEFATRKMDLEKSRVLRQIYDSIKNSIAETAADNGHDLVLVDDSVVELPENATETEMMRQISARRILHANQEIDITRLVITRMNGEFNARHGG